MNPFFPGVSHKTHCAAVPPLSPVTCSHLWRWGWWTCAGRSVWARRPGTRTDSCPGASRPWWPGGTLTSPRWPGPCTGGPGCWWCCSRPEAAGSGWSGATRRPATQESLTVLMQTFHPFHFCGYPVFSSPKKIKLTSTEFVNGALCYGAALFRGICHILINNSTQFSGRSQV